MDSCSKEIGKPKVLMLPWLSHGHVSPFVELAKHLSRSNFHVYICTTPVILQSIKAKIVNYSSSIEPIELRLPPHPDLPPNLHTTQGLPSQLFPILYKSFISCGPKISTILQDIKPHLVLYDICFDWFPPLASPLGIPVVHTITSGAAATAFILHSFKREGIKFPFRDILPTHPHTSHDGLARMFIQWFDLSCSIVLIKGCNAIEAKYVNYLSELTGKKVIAMGPLVDPNPQVQVPARANENEQILGWLDKKEPFSTVLVSFGTEFHMDNKEEVEELAYGLELSNVNFIWVVRFPPSVVVADNDGHDDGVDYKKKKKGMSVEEAMPSGFLERVVGSGRGYIVDGWAPQTQILAHGNVGGFVSHCGWGSTTEAMYFGVPIIGMPRENDQPLNARLVEEVGVGVEVLRDENGKYKSAAVAGAIKEVMGGSGGEEFRRKAKDVREKLRKEGQEAPIVVAEEIAKLCQIKLCDQF